MDINFQRVVKIELGEIRNQISFSTRTITIFMEDGKEATVTCFSTNEDGEPTEALKVTL